MRPATEPTVERQLDLDAPVEEVWEAICRPDTWLADEGTLPVEPGAVGRLVEGGRSRTVVVEEVEPGRRLVYRWWDDSPARPGGEHDADEVSRVDITLIGGGGGTRVVVRETTIAATLDARATVSLVGDGPWERRFTWLSFEATARTPVRA